MQIIENLYRHSFELRKTIIVAYIGTHLINQQIISIRSNSISNYKTLRRTKTLTLCAIYRYRPTEVNFPQGRIMVRIYWTLGPHWRNHTKYKVFFSPIDPNEELAGLHLEHASPCRSTDLSAVLLLQISKTLKPYLYNSWNNQYWDWM